MIPVSIILRVLLILPWMRAMSRHRRMMHVVMLLVIAWMMILVIQQELFHMMRTVMVIMIIVMQVHGPIVAVIPNVRGRRLFVLAGTAFSALWMPIAGSA